MGTLPVRPRCASPPKPSALPPARPRLPTQTEVYTRIRDKPSLPIRYGTVGHHGRSDPARTHLVADDDGHIAVAHSAFQENEASRVRLIRGRRGD